MFNIPSFFGFRAGGSVPLLLDEFPGAAAAYSLRLLDSTYLGDAIQVRESTGNTTLDIGFVNGELDTASLLAHCAGANGFVTEWFDQSGNANNATQGVALDQPQIVSSGSVILENGKPCILGLGFNTKLIISATLISPITAQNFAIFSTIAPKDLSLNFRILFSQFIGGNVGRLICYNSFNTQIAALQIGSNNAILNGTVTNDLACFYHARFNGDSLICGKNSNSGAVITSTQSVANINSMLFNAIGSSGGFDDTMGEIIIYNSDENSNRLAIQQNQADFYAITL